MKHKIINGIIKKNGYTSYLEIGYGHGTNFKQIQCQNKLAVDPVLSHAKVNVRKMRSDQFFEKNVAKWDCIFIDGLHHADQVRRDINNASACLSEKGCIILHDTIPPNEAAQIVPRKQSQWTGDVWRAVYGLTMKYDIDDDMYTYRADYGLTLIFPKGKIFTGEYEDMEFSYSNFMQEIEYNLNIK